MARSILTPYKAKNRYIPKHVKHEESLQRQVCHYLRLQYPNIVFRSDFASGLHLTMYQAKTHKSLQSGRSWPDLFIYHPSRGYHGLALELKKEGTIIYVTTGPNVGKLRADMHLQEQALMLQHLNKLGYFARFAVGFDKAQKIIDWYLDIKKTPENQELPF